MDITNEERHGRWTFSPAIPQLQGARRNRLRSRSRKFQLLSSRFLPPQESATANSLGGRVSTTHYPEETAVQKIQVVVQKMQANHSDFECKLSFGFECTSLAGDQRAPEYSLGRAPTARNMKRYSLCHGKLGLGVRFRNIWNGTWWVHVRFCSVRCGAIYQDTQNNAATHTAGTPSLLTALRGAECL